jgi:glycine/D-amino acid oxidase-like deaminating enzyme
VSSRAPGPIGSSAGPADRHGPVVIVGGGVIGLCLAYYLAEAGASVDLVERHTVGSAASWGNAGWVCESHSAPIPAPGIMSYALRSLGRPDSPLYLRPSPDPTLLGWLWRFWRSTNQQKFDAGYRAVADLNRDTFELYEKLAAAGVGTTLRRVGMVHAFLSRQEAVRSRDLQAQAAPDRYDLGGEIVDGDGAAGLDPALSDAVRAAYLVPGEGVVDPERFTAGLAKAALESGVRIHDRTLVTGFRLESGRAVAVQTSAGSIDCSAVAVTAGMWSAQLLRMLQVRLALQAGKGYSFSVHLDPAPQHALYLGDSKIAVTPIGHTTRIAGTMELSGNNRRMDWRRIVAIAQASTPYLGPWFTDADDLNTQIHDPWVGARPLLPDGLPVIDRLPNLGNAYVATGHGMLGVTLGPATGQSLAELILLGQRPKLLEPFSFHRSTNVGSS